MKERSDSSEPSSSRTNRIYDDHSRDEDCLEYLQNECEIDDCGRYIYNVYHCLVERSDSNKLHLKRVCQILDQLYTS